jgi:hypothetical protein
MIIFNKLTTQPPISTSPKQSKNIKIKSNHVENVSTVDLSKSLPNRHKKKVSVTRSFSYTIGNLTGSTMNRSSLNDSDKLNESKQDISKNKTSFSLLSDAFGLSKSTNNKKNRSKNDNSSMSNLNQNIEAVDTSNKSNKSKNNKKNAKSATTTVVIEEEQNLNLSKPLYLPTLDSNSDLKCASASSVSLLAFARNEPNQELKNVYDFQHVSV